MSRFVQGMILVGALAFSGSAKADDLKKLSADTRELAGRIDTIMGNIEASVKEAEEATNKISDKGDTAAIADANRKIDNLKAGTAKLDTEVDNLRKLAIKLEKEIAKAKK